MPKSRRSQDGEKYDEGRRGGEARAGKTRTSAVRNNDLRGKKTRGGTLIGIAFGLLIGVLISFGVVWYLNKTPLPFVEKILGNEPKPADSANKTPLPLPGKPGDKPIEKPAERKFEFYDILEGKKSAAPATDRPAAAANTAANTTSTPAEPIAPPAQTTPAAPAPNSRLYLQAGAFQKTADAEKLKGRLAMLGIEANVSAMEVPDKGVMHRVRVGPYASTEEMNQARGLLSQSGIPATVVRVKD